MRVSISLIVFVSVFLIFGCTQKDGIHEVVQLDSQNKASDEVYIKYLTDQISQFPEEADNYLKLANIYKGQNSDKKSIILLERAKDENPESISILIELASLYLKDEDAGKLSKSLNSIRKQDPDNMDFLKLSAGYALLLGDYTNAIFFANRAMLANPYDDENYYLRGWAQLIHKDSINALISLEEAYKLRNSIKNFSGVFDVALALGKDVKAKKYLEEFSANNPEMVLCYEWGSYFNEIGKMDSSKVILMKCMESQNHDPRLNLELAKIYYKSNDNDSALYYINKYITSNPKGIDAFVLKAKTLEKKSYYTEAEKLYKYALEMDSTSILASRGLENLERKVAYLRLVKRKEAVQRQVEELKPLNSKEIN